MKRKNLTRNALVTSILSLLLCVSMLVGTTFAWFTDEVVTGMNTISAGNLDIELLAGGNKVDNTTKLFDDVQLWEPGVVLFEDLQVANVGTLALKYQMTLNFGKENDLNGNKLSEVLQVALLDKADVTNWNDRAEVLEKAQNAEYIGTLQNFYITGTLLAGKTADLQSVVIFWAPTDHDNDYNANNGQTTSDGKPLHIEFGINLQATQLMHEEDSFGKDYDEAATIMPKAKVTGLPGEELRVVWGIGGAEGTLNAPFKMKFEPNETYEEAAAGAYGLYHADFVVKADRDVPADSIALAGYYTEWCKLIDHRWVALTNENFDVQAGEEVRLVGGMGATVSYEEICKYGNDGTGFMCTAADLTGANAGTTITVELRMFKVPAKGECANGGGCNHPSVDCEVVPEESYLIGTYTYTFPAVQAANQADLDAALATGGDVELAAGTYTFPASKMQAGQTLYCEEGTVFEGTSSLNIEGATVVGATFKNDNGYAASGTINGNFKDCTFESGEALRWCYAGENVVFENCEFKTNFRGIHFDGMDYDVTFINCKINGFNAFGGSATVTFEGCTFGCDKSNYNGLNMYTDLVLKDCKFEYTSGKTNFVDFEAAGKTLTIENCTATLDGAAVDVLDYVGGTNKNDTTITVK